MLRFITVFIVVILAGLSFLPNIKAPAISIVMSTYNREAQLPNAIESMLNQSFRDFEFIIINDGSPDNTQKILEKYAALDSRIKIVNNVKNKGLVFSLNAGLKVARGKYIARMDDDDIALPNRLLIQYNYMEKNSQITAVGSAWYDDSIKAENLNYVKATPIQLRIQSYMQVPLLHPSTLIRTSFLKKHRIQYESEFKTAEDTRFWYQISRHNGYLATIEEPLLIYNTQSTKHTGYHEEQGASFNRFIRASLGELLPLQMISWPPSYYQKCIILYAMKTAKNLDGYHITQKEAADEFEYHCGETPVLMFPFSSPEWTSYVATYAHDETRICRFRTDICGKISAQSPQEVSIEWDDGKTATYIRMNDAIYYEK